MSQDIIENILKFLLTEYLTMSDGLIAKHLQYDDYCETKKKVGIIKDLELHIHSNDHNPPHFHVKTNDLKINAKFTIENCDLISGEINAKYLKRVKAMFNSPKGKIVFQKIWDNRLK